MKLCVIGTGYVGLVSGVCYSHIGHEVVCVDRDQEKIKRLSQGEVPIFEPGLEDMLASNMAAGRLSFTTRLSDGLAGADAAIIAVGTPARADGSANLDYVEAVAKEIGSCITAGLVVITKSTVPVGTNRKVKNWIAETCGHEDFEVASCPEFLREGTAIADTLEMERAVIGVESVNAERLLRDLHKPFQTTIVACNLETAEMAKYAANAFLATKISFINEVANVCEQVGADVTFLAEAIGLDHRIGRHFLKAGIGYGGSCFPKDTQAFIRVAQQAGYDLQIVPAVERVNAAQRLTVVHKLKTALGHNLAGKQIAMLGLAFKPNTDDMRAAPALDVYPALEREQANTVAFDPIATEQAKAALPGIQLANTWQQAVKDADAVLLLTDWETFKDISLPELKKLTKQPIVIDGRNMFDPKEMEMHGFYYDSVGRPVVDGRLERIREWEDLVLGVYDRFANG
ncbi:UDP-glucose dehydrogenase family protein [Shouchella clausii]|uniref:UDP-glucose dehydrogenase family protein n=1 Tax=Shouchella clausii TaxID=79880 RepID=UPI000BA7CEBF|nr:UDP-glucose/GDP-mannose dehydrogenase family protein [Shouchella clausii]MCM3313095.1 UDP-glucose/GDP-mannose dehydrogenase family protein [Psychrobacillus sp. MER TA 17]PAE94461.1 UDP-glucose 6-dehydrogenase [Shouchella clausii]